jgi:hypothetical protein
MTDPRNLLDRAAQVGPMVGFVPAHTHAALLRYIEHGARLGGFCTAVLVNDLMGAVRRADEDNIVALPLIVAWLTEHAPAASWGSPERVEAWIAQRGRQAYAAAEGPGVRP